MKNIYKEIFWMILVIGFALISFHFMFGISTLKGNNIDINIHDTYFVINALDFFIPFLLFIFIGVYLARIINQKFENIIANIIFLIANSIQLFLFSSITYFIFSELRFDIFNSSIVSLTFILFVFEVVVGFKLLKIIKKHSA